MLYKRRGVKLMTENKQPVIIGIGELLWDMLPSGKRAGGAPINFVYHATQMGADGYAVSAVGKDASGDEILSELEKNGIKHCITRNDYPTGYVKVVLNNGIPSYDIVEDVAWDHLTVSPESVALVKTADAVCYGTLASRHAESRAAVETLLSAAPDRALRFFDVNLRQNYYSRELIEKLLGKANIFKINDDEIVVLKDLFGLTGEPDDVCRAFIDRFGLKYMIFTAGEKFSAIYTETQKSRLPTPKVDVADTVGAGDSFSGAFVYNILTGKSLEQAHRSAVDIAAFVSTKSGAWPEYEGGSHD